MKKNLCIIFIILLSAGIGACASTSQNSKTSLDWQGNYAGLIPAADTPGINVQITLRADQSFTIVYDYIDRQGVATESGSFSWDKDGNIITLGNTAFPPYYLVSENQLLQLDSKGKKITGNLADQYVLKKTK